MKSRYYPDYDVLPDNSEQIPHPQCLDVLHVYADYGNAYLWDMNGYCIEVESVVGDVGWGLDAKFTQWCARFDFALQVKDTPAEFLEAAKVASFDVSAFDEEGLRLTKELYELLGRRKTVFYVSYPGNGRRVWFDAEGSPPVRCVDRP